MPLHLGESSCTYNRVSNNAQKANNVGSTCQVLKDLDFTSNLLLLDGLQGLDDALFIVDNVDALKDFRVFATADFANDFIVFLVSNKRLGLIFHLRFIIHIFTPTRLEDCHSPSKR